MLYAKWRLIAQVHREELALVDAANRTRWTFGQLADLTELPPNSHQPSTPSLNQSLACPRGNGPEFIFDVLRAWRSNQVLCPLEPEQAPPELGARLPSGVVHVKVTSATTDRPRLVAFTAAQLMADGDNIVQTMGLRPDWPNLG